MKRQISMPYPTCGHDICAVITTYHPDLKFPIRVERVRSQVGRVVIVDDAGDHSNFEILQKWFSHLPDVTLYHNRANEGIAFSLNMGIAIARSHGYDWLLTLDDDSTVDKKMVERLIHYYRRIDGHSPIGLIGMSWTQPGVPPE
ncbi:MAG: glycosyltransferase, partial [bacterium]